MSLFISTKAKTRFIRRSNCYLGNDGSFDSCIAIRSAFVKDKTAYVQAGCGVVFDSDIKAECQETVNKARSVLTALAMAQEK